MPKTGFLPLLRKITMDMEFIMDSSLKKNQFFYKSRTLTKNQNQDCLLFVQGTLGPCI